MGGSTNALFACSRPSPVHQDFHPGNVLVSADDGARVIDWTNFSATDPRFDLAWTLILAHLHGRPELRSKIFQGDQRKAGKLVDHIDSLEAIACARRLLDLTVSLTLGGTWMGMNALAAEAMRASQDGTPTGSSSLYRTYWFTDRNI